MVSFFAFAYLCVYSSMALSEPRGRVIILGFDGVDPKLAQAMMDAGELPNLAKLRDMGQFEPLLSTIPPQSPTAWSSFLTCRNPINHGIFDFVRRNAQTYIPGLGFGGMEQPKLNPDGSLAQAPQYVSHRKGTSFWKVASDHGRKVKALVVPFAYPADDLCDECSQLCGLDVPDIRGTQSTYFAMSEAFSQEEPVAGGVRLPLVFQDNKAEVKVPGIAIPGKRGEYARVPVLIQVDRTAKRLDIEVQGQKVSLGENEWSPWLEWTFELSPKYSVRAISRFHLLSAGDVVRLYMTCLQMHPKAPMLRISSPYQYSAELADRFGLYKTIGWEFDTKALQQGDMTEEMFLQDVEQTFAWTQHLSLYELDQGPVDLFISATTATDRVSHMFWAYRDPKHPLYTEEMAKKYGRAVENIYIKMDGFVGEVMKRLQPNDLFIVMSDHGFHSFRTEFSVNTWLIRNGYLAVKGRTDAATAYTDEKFLQGFDWSRTRAYALGQGMIFLNRKGREGQGIVTPEEVPALLSELKEKLLAVRDPETGERVINAVYVNERPTGECAEHAPDIQLGYAEGYQTAKASASGAAPKEVFAPNTNKWSGEHASSDAEGTSGIFFCNQKLKTSPRILDLGVTALQYLDVPVPADMEGRSLFP
jgi:predicted AlkP superfamily phosphohydrolase/phosphomutase